MIDFHAYKYQLGMAAIMRHDNIDFIVSIRICITTITSIYNS